MTTRDRVHRLVDELPDDELHAAERYLARLREIASDPVLRAFMLAPEDDEPLTPDEIIDIEEAKAEIARGEFVSWGEACSRLQNLQAE
jgi:hypothetical protein